MVFSSMGSGVGIANDLQTGMIDRFRSLPDRPLGLPGRSDGLSDSLRLGIQAVLLVLMSFILGFSFHNGAPAAVAMIVVIVLFGLALATFSAWVGLTIGDPETVQAGRVRPAPPAGVHELGVRADLVHCRAGCSRSPRSSPITAAIDLARGLALGDKTL